MNKEYAGLPLETRCNLARFHIYSTDDKNGRIRWWRHLQGFGTRRISQDYAEMKLREYGLTLDEAIKANREFRNEKNWLRL